MGPMNANEPSRAAFSIPSILAVVAAVASFYVGAFFGLLLAGLAVVLGAVGVVLTLSPKTRGGIFSMIGVAGGFIGIIAAVIKAIMWLLT